MAALRDRRAIWQKALLRVALLGVALAGTVNLARGLYLPVPSDGVRWQSRAGELVALEVPGTADELALAVGDRLLGVDGWAISSPLDLHLLDREAEVGSERRYRVARGDQTLELDVPVRRGRAPRGYLLLAMVGLASLAAAVRLMSRAATGRGATPAAAASIAFAAIALCSPVGWMGGFDRLAIALDDAGRLALAPLLVHAALCLAGIERGRWRAALYIPAVVIGVADGLFLFYGGSLPAAQLGWLSQFVDRAMHVQLVAAVVVAAAVAFTAYSRARGVERGRLRWLLLGAVAGFGPYSLTVAAPAVLGFAWPGLGALSVLPLALLPLCLGNAFVGRPLRLEDLARNTLVFGSTLLMTAGAALAAAALVSEALVAVGLPGGAGYVLVALLVTAGFFERGRSALRDWVDASVDRRGYDARRTLLEFGRDLAIDPRLPELSAALLDRLTRAFGLETAALYVRGEAEGHLSLLRVEPDGGVAPVRLEVRPGDAIHSERTRVVQFGDSDATARPPVLDPRFELAVPLVVRGRMVGALFLGSGGRRLSDRERRLLADLAGYAAVALENAGLHAEVRRQVSAVRELEQFRASVLESLGVGVLILDLEGRVLSTNRAFRELLGREHIAEGAPAATELPPLFMDPPSSGESERRSMGERELALGASLLRRADGSVQGRIIVVEDITEQVSEERERARREKLASIGLLSAGIAHEVNTPLAGIASYVQMLLERTSEEDPRRPLLGKIEKQSFRASRLVRNLLNFARTKEESAAPFDLNEAVREGVSLLEHQAKRRRIVVEYELSPSLPAVLGRFGEIEQVVVNLVKNALDASREGGVVRVVTGRTGLERAYVAVEDSGAGIPTSDQERIFDPFFTTKQRGSGHGLGLSVAYGIVKGHSGDIRIDSESGRGARVQVELRAAPVGMVSGEVG